MVTITDRTKTKEDKKTITQEYYDETLLENEEIFEWNSLKAVHETISELKSQNVTLNNIITLHPNSKEGKIAREDLRFFKKLIQKDLDNFVKSYCGVSNKEVDVETWIVFEELKRCIIPEEEEEKRDNKVVENSNSTTEIIEEGNADIDYLEIFVKLSGIQSLLILITTPTTQKMEESESITEGMIQFLILCFQLCNKKKPYVKREIQNEITGFIPDCMNMLKKEDYPSILIKVMNMSCHGHEKNKVTIMSSNEAPEILISFLSHDKSNQTTITSMVCQLISSLCRYDDSTAITSSAHQNVLSFVNAGLLDPLFDVIKSELQQQQQQQQGSNNKADDDDSKSKKKSLLCSTIITTFRTLAINDEIIQQLLNKGILPIINQTFMLAFQTESLNLARANLGIVRNMCQNDDIKCTFCNEKEYLKMILEVVSTCTYSNDYQVQEHFCSIIGAMALRYPSNAKKIVFETNSVEYIIKAMKCYKENVTLQRQGCLAIRNLVSRDDTPDKQLSTTILDLGVEEVLKEAGMFLGSVDEAYAALRDLGCKASLLRVDKNTGEVHVGVEMFGQVKTAFRPTYEQTNTDTQ